MAAPITVGGLLNGTGSAGMAPATIATTGEFDATECDKVLLMATAVGLAGAETVSIYTRHPDGTNAIGGGPPGTVPVYDATGAAASLTASRQTVMLEGGFLYVFAKSVTAGLCGVAVDPKRAQGA